MNFEGQKNQFITTIIMGNINKLYYVKTRTSVPQEIPLKEKTSYKVGRGNDINVKIETEHRYRQGKGILHRLYKIQIT